MNLALKIILSVLAGIAVAFFGLVMLVFVAFSGAGYFYQTLVAVVAAVLFLFAILNIWGLMRTKIRWIALGVASAAVLVSVAGFEIYRSFDDRILEVNDRGVDLSLYDPLREDTLAASLPEAATLSIDEDPPRLDGATALYPVYASFVRAVFSKDLPNESASPLDEKTVQAQKAGGVMGGLVACTGTGDAYQRLVAGETDVIFVAGPSQEQQQMAKDAGVELKLTPIGHEAFVFFVNAKNPVNSLTSADVQGIYSGKITNWKQLGGKNAGIRAFQRPDNSGSQTALVRIMGDTPLMAPPKKDVAGGMGDIISQVSSYKNYDNAIGYSFLFYATQMVKDNQIKLLSIDGVEPTRENVANATYPYAADLYAVTAGTTNPNVDRLIQWILSPQGQYLVDKTGYTPLGGGGTRP